MAGKEQSKAPSKEEQKAIIKNQMYQYLVEREQEWASKPENQADYALLKQMLNEINAFGFDFKYFYDIKRLLITNEEVVQIILKYLGKFENPSRTASLVNSISHKNNKFVTDKIIEMFNKYSSDMRKGQAVSYDNALNRLKDKRYIDQYLEWLADPDMAAHLPLTMVLLARWKHPKARELFFQYASPEIEKPLAFTVINAMAVYRDDEAKDKLLVMQKSTDENVSGYAKKTYNKLIAKEKPSSIKE